jgi:hypothetical protein
VVGWLPLVVGIMLPRLLVISPTAEVRSVTMGPSTPLLLVGLFWAGGLWLWLWLVGAGVVSVSSPTWGAVAEVVGCACSGTSVVGVGVGAGVEDVVSSGRPMMPIPVVVGDGVAAAGGVVVGLRIPPITSPTPSKRPPEDEVDWGSVDGLVSLTRACLFTTLGK